MTRDIAAPLDLVFRTVADVRQLRRALLHITNVTFLTDQQWGVGTRYREVRLMPGGPQTNELEVTEFVENDHVRIVTENQGIIWDTLFQTEHRGEGTRLTVTMDARTGNVLRRLMTRVFKSMISRGIARDMDLVQVYCERRASGGV